MKTTLLVRTPKAGRIVDDVRRQIRDGLMKPGDGLRPYRDLMRLYETSQSVLVRALDALEEAGLIIRRRRSGCFVAADAPARLAAEAAASPSQSAGPHAIDAAMRVFNVMPPQASGPITILTTDCMPAQLAVWDDLLGTHAARTGTAPAKIESSPLAFSPTSPQQRHIDIVYGPPHQLYRIGEDSFVPVPDPGRMGLSATEMVPPLRRYVAATPAAPGMPLAVGFPMLFLNADLAAELGYAGFARATSPLRMIRDLRNVLERPSRGTDRYTADFDSPARLMLHEGAMHFDKRSGITLGLARTRRLLEAWAALLATNASSRRLGWADFLAGKLLVKSGFGFCAMDARDRAGFRWQARVYPLARGAEGESMPLLMAVRKDTPRLPQCVDLLEFLCSREAQMRLAARGDVIPARADAVMVPDIPLAPAMNPKSFAVWLKRLAPTSSDTAAESQFIADLENVGFQMAASGASIDQTMGRIEILMDRYHHLKAMGPPPTGPSPGSQRPVRGQRVASRGETGDEDDAKTAGNDGHGSGSGGGNVCGDGRAAL
ncbi:MAG TPA: winged helix-turn-helix domain-containing protein [Phycisphaerae bacterium]|nr:winged helix-turn-helix domain-containing protein [Phycisphaerae bacterium]